MAESKLGKLVKEAKGSDRSIRQYAVDSGVDAAIISKIINGSYTPKKTDIYQKLTSAKASPRGNITFEQLVEAADSSNSYVNGMIAGVEVALSALPGIPLSTLGIAGAAGAIAAAGAAGAALAGFNKTKGKKKKEELDKKEKLITNEIHRFITTSNGLLYGCLGTKGISFKVETDKDKRLFDNIYDTYIMLEGQIITEYIIRYLYLSTEQQNIRFIVENTPRKMIEELLFISPCKNRKVSLVTNCADSYKYISSFKDKLSYNGELSVVLINESTAQLVKETYISHHAESKAKDELLLL